MLRPAPARGPYPRGAWICAVSLLAAACSPRATVTRRPATPAERTAVVECAAAVVTTEGFTVTERRPDLGRLSATTGPDDGGGTAPAPTPKGGGDLALSTPGAGPPIDLLTVSIAKHPLTAGIALLVQASAQAGDSVVSPTHRAAIARDRIIRSCAYLVG